MKNNFKKLPRSFFLEPTVVVAKKLLGKLLVRRIGGKLLVGKIVETEAYCSNDPASHSFRGQTPRNSVMFGPPGHLYVYFTYGMHFCSNVVTNSENIGEAVLLRAVEPLKGCEIMSKFRNFPTDDIRLTNGPAKLCSAFQLLRIQNGIDLLGDEIFLASNPSQEKFKIVSSTRIGITNGTDKKWRFYIKDNKYVSK